MRAMARDFDQLAVDFQGVAQLLGRDAHGVQPLGVVEAAGPADLGAQADRPPRGTAGARCGFRRRGGPPGWRGDGGSRSPARLAAGAAAGRDDVEHGAATDQALGAQVAAHRCASVRCSDTPARGPISWRWPSATSSSRIGPSARVMRRTSLLARSERVRAGGFGQHRQHLAQAARGDAGAMHRRSRRRTSPRAGRRAGQRAAAAGSGPGAGDAAC